MKQELVESVIISVVGSRLPSIFPCRSLMMSLMVNIRVSSRSFILKFMNFQLINLNSITIQLSRSPGYNRGTKASSFFTSTPFFDDPAFPPFFLPILILVLFLLLFLMVVVD